MYSFTRTIENWDDWGRVYQSIPDFTPVAKAAFWQAGLPFTALTPLTPGTNGVFRSGNCVIKLFAPKESGVDSSRDFETELFAGEWAGSRGIQAPRLLGHGCVRDKYDFYFTITEFICGRAFAEAADGLAPKEKRALGCQLRIITDKMNVLCPPFNGIDFRGEDRQRRWENYPESFQKERRAYISEKDYGEKVFLHGDINADNIILKKDGAVYLIDFADALLAPICYEHASITSDLFHFDPDFMYGYFGEVTVEEIEKICFDGLLIHDFGGDIIAHCIAAPEKLDSLKALQAAITELCRFW